VQKWIRPVSVALIIAVGAGALLTVQSQREERERSPAGLPDVVATVGGEPIRKDELLELIAPGEAQLEAQRFEMRRQAVEQLVAQRLVEKEAAQKGVTVQELLEKEIMSQAPPPSEEEVRAFFDEHAAEMGGQPFEAVAPQISEHLGRQAAEQRLQTYFDDLKSRTPVEIRLEAPRIEIETAGQPRLGPADAKVTVVEFSDFQCPYCADAAGVMKQVADKYGDDVAIVYRNFPLASHADARPAAEAAECALDQGKFWELHDRMFAAPADLGREQLVAHAGAAGLDVAKFSECLDSGAKAAEVDADLAAGEQAGVQGTPALYVNGRALTGPATVDELSRMIDQELGRKPSS
jgi:protein-disulfide isomerase